MASKNLTLPRNKVVGYITTEEVDRKGFELIGFFDGMNVYKLKENKNEQIKNV